MIEISPQLQIPEAELSFTFSRSSGPGGQNVNKVETRVTLCFDVTASPSLSAQQRERIRERLATRINRAGVLRVVCQRHRSQPANQRAAVERFVELLGEALTEAAPRVETAVPRAVKRRRVEAKRRHSRVKRLRGRPGTEE